MTRDELRDLIHADLVMQGVSDGRFRQRFKVTRGVVFCVWLLRRLEFWSSQTGPLAKLVTLSLKVRYRRQCERLGFELPPGTCGAGLSIAHSGLLVIHPDARVGARCRLHQGVTIGASSTGTPVIGDDVSIGPNAQVLGGVTVGDGALIYPGAVVVRDVPAGSGARGVPAVAAGPHGEKAWRPDGWSGDQD